MLDERKAAILRTVVEEYIETAQPVGSAHVAQATSLSVSSATVRNEMAVLEHEGYLVQPHTSAGRIPTDKGYRFFVDHLTEPGVLGPAQVQRVRDFFDRAHGELERMLHDTSRLLSSVTDYAAVVVSPPHEAAVIRSAQLVRLAPRVALVVVVLGNGVVEKRTVDLDEGVDDASLGAASAHLATQLVGSTLAQPATPVSSGDAVTDGVVAAAVAALADDDDDGPDQVFMGGVARMASAFDGVETVRKVVGILEQQYVVVSLLRDVLDRGLSVAIGSEHGLEQLSTCAVVVAPYEVEGRVSGAVGVLGPTRMNYPQALAAVAMVSQRLGRRLSEG
ncbi:MAG TPA: heat-inducible transcriptional repressor HrcA [Acidimicrobiales bacterium]|nr:heat-inducible transcriptional repressor HrcA [Acidimicrobiales bacterium]